VFLRRQHASRHVIGPIGSEQELEQSGRVDHDQRPSRSSRTILVGDVLPR